MDDMITISKEEYAMLREQSEFLECLRACGVDNWGGYGDAQDMAEEAGIE